MGFFFKRLNSESELEDYVREEGYDSDSKPGLCVGIVIEGSGNNYNIKLRYDDNFMVEEINRKQQIPSTRKLVVDPLDDIPKDDSHNMYHTSGFVYLQYLMIKILGGTSINSLKVGFIPMGTPEYKDNDSFQITEYLIGMAISMCYLGSMVRIISMIVQDKETKIR